MAPKYIGKVRDVYEVGDYLILKATDRISCFDKSVGEMEGKGELLNKMSTFWLKNTQHIIDNHFINADRQSSFVQKCTPFPIEVIVRGYIAGNTSTSLWTHYNNGARTYCDIIFPHGLVRDQQLPEPVITPTTKGVVDKPISRADIIAENYMTEE